jgi:signal transduction histidine kinase
MQRCGRPAPHPLARRLHDRVLGLLGTALLKTELCERLSELGRQDEVPKTLAELRAALDQTIVELRAIMAELRTLPDPEPSSLPAPPPEPGR